MVFPLNLTSEKQICLELIDEYARKGIMVGNSDAFFLKNFLQWPTSKDEDHLRKQKSPN